MSNDLLTKITKVISESYFPHIEGEVKAREVAERVVEVLRHVPSVYQGRCQYCREFHDDKNVCLAVASLFVHKAELERLEAKLAAVEAERDWYKESCLRHDEWREQFTARGKDLDSQTVHGCICPAPARKEDGTYDWKIVPECIYHATALKYPSNHSIPWNCPTYWDGCNCSDHYEKRDKLKAHLDVAVKALERIKSHDHSGHNTPDSCLTFMIFEAHLALSTIKGKT